MIKKKLGHIAFQQAPIYIQGRGSVFRSVSAWQPDINDSPAVPTTNLDMSGHEDGPIYQNWRTGVNDPTRAFTLLDKGLCACRAHW